MGASANALPTAETKLKAFIRRMKKGPEWYFGHHIRAMRTAINIIDSVCICTSKT